jgi:hypothetical protein
MRTKRLAPLLLSLAVAATAAAQTPPITSEFQVNTYTTGGQYGYGAQLDRDGGFVLTWDSDGEDLSSWTAVARVFDEAQAPLTGDLQVNTFTTGTQEYTRASMDGSGRFVVVWTSESQDGSNYGIFARRFDHTGGPLGDDFQVNEYTTNFQSHPYVSSDSSGELVVVWDSYGQDDTSSVGVYGQRLAALPSLSVADVAVKEGKPRTGKSIFVPVRLSSASPQTATVDYATEDGSANAGADYLASSGTLTFAPGETLRTIVVLIRGDGKTEDDETLFVNLSKPTNATLADSQAVVTILNDDP